VRDLGRLGLARGSRSTDGEGVHGVLSTWRWKGWIHAPGKLDVYLSCDIGYQTVGYVTVMSGERNTLATLLAA